MHSSEIEKIGRDWASKYTFHNAPSYHGTASLFFRSTKTPRTNKPAIKIVYETQSGSEYCAVTLTGTEDSPYSDKDLYIVDIENPEDGLPAYIYLRAGKDITLSKVEEWLGAVHSIYTKSNPLKQAAKPQMGYKLQAVKDKSGKRPATPAQPAVKESAARMAPTPSFKVGDYVKMATGGQLVCKIIDETAPGKFKLRAKLVNPSLRGQPLAGTNLYTADKNQMKPIRMKHVGEIQDVSDQYGSHFITLLPDGEVLNGFSKQRVKEHFDMYLRKEAGKQAQTKIAYPAASGLSQIAELLIQWGNNQSPGIDRLAQALRSGETVDMEDIQEARKLLVDGELASGYWANDKEALTELRAIHYALNEIEFIENNCDEMCSNFDDVMDHLKTKAGEDYLHNKANKSVTANFKRSYKKKVADELEPLDGEEAEVPEEETSEEDLLIMIRDSFDNGQFTQMVEQIKEYGGLADVLAQKSSLGISTGDLLRICHIYCKKTGC